MPFTSSNRSTVANAIVPEILQAEDDGSPVSANWAGYGQVVMVQANGTIGDAPSGADEDTYLVWGFINSPLRVDVDAQILGSSLDASIEIYDAFNNLVASNDNEAGIGLDPFVVYPGLVDNNIYRIVIKASPLATGAAATGDYRVFINVEPPGVPAFRILHGTGSGEGVGGTGGSDIIYGAGGADSLAGGPGDDLFVWHDGDGSDTVDGGNQTDAQEVNASNAPEVFTLGASGANAIFTGTGLPGGDVTLTLTRVERFDLRALGGNDSFVVTSLAGTTLTGPITFRGGDGNDALDGSGASNAFTAFGDAGNDALTGGSAVDALSGGAGDDALNGGGGADIMAGGAGDDVYVIDDAGDVADETSVSGSDTLQAMLSYSLADVHVLGAVENLTLLGGATDATGNALANVLIGNGNANRLDGAAGADTLIGAAGDDTYSVDDFGDVVDESTAAGDGSDTVQSLVSFSLIESATVRGAVENLALLGAAVMGTGNGLANTLTGNDGRNILDGRGGADTMIGAGGDDVLVGSLGRDVFLGGAGADRFDFDSLAQSVKGKQHDLIAGFSHAEDDRIDLATIDADTAGTAGNQAFKFIGARAFHGVDGELRFAGGTPRWGHQWRRHRRFRDQGDRRRRSRLGRPGTMRGYPATTRGRVREGRELMDA